MEILAPVKDYYATKVAIQSGADAIYCAAPFFGARVDAAIEMVELEKIIYYANLYQVKVYITLNTVIFDDELPRFWEIVDQIYTLGADGIILQDPAFIPLVKKNYPDLEVHASTQMNIHNLSAIQFVQEQGANRVVLPREMTIERIKKLRQQTDIEFEVFGQGALCVSYSGLCFDSTLLDQKSANRGRCSQYCRMPQQIVHGPTKKVIRTGHPLNLSDLSVHEHLEDFKKAGINSLKIEGRLKHPEYVMVHTKNYKSGELLIKGERVYNRGFTKGRIFSQNGKNLVNLTRPNNSGYFIGEVEKVKPINHSYYKYELTISTTETLNKLDNLRIISSIGESGQVIDEISQTNSGYTIKSLIKANPGDKVFRTRENALEVECRNLASSFNRRVVKDIFIDLDNYYFIYNNQIHEFTMELSQTTPLTQATICEHLQKTKHTMFDLAIDLSYINEQAFTFKSIKKLKQQILTVIAHNQLKHRKSNKITPLAANCQSAETSQIFCEVRTREQYDYLTKQLPSANIVINSYQLAKEITPKPTDFLLINRINYEDEYEELDLLAAKFSNLVVSEIGAFNYFQKKGKNIITSFALNTTNQINRDFLLNNGASMVSASIELNEEKLKTLAHPRLIIPVYGRIPVMIMDYCPINQAKTNTCGNCRACRGGEYYLEDKLGRKFPLLYEGNYRIGMYANRPMNLLPLQDKLKQNNLNNYYLLFTDEKIEEIKEVIDNLLYNRDVKFKTNYGSFYKQTL